MRVLINTIFLSTILFWIVTASFFTVRAQFQNFEFSGSDVNSYYCLDGSRPNFADNIGRWICASGEEALRKPPKFQQLEIWFVRILYAIWSLVAALSFFMLVNLGYQYMISRGDVTKITIIRQRIVNYIIGFVLVFLSIPVLTTVFRVMGINTAADCYDLKLPTFQFFFVNLCTTGTSDTASLTSQCLNGTLSGKGCTTSGSTYSCRPTTGTIRTFVCCSDVSVCGEGRLNTWWTGD